MQLPGTVGFNNINKLIFAIRSLTDDSSSCRKRAVVDLCQSISFYGSHTDYEYLIRLAEYARLISFQSGLLKLTKQGAEFADLNKERTFELTNLQRRYIVCNLLFNGPWKKETTGYFSLFSPNYKLVTYELSDYPSNIPVRYSSLNHTLKTTGVLFVDGQKLYVTPNYVSLVRGLLNDESINAIDKLDASLEFRKKLGNLAENLVVNFEKTRLLDVSRSAESELVTKISDLQPNAGYDINSFDGEQPEIEYSRFIEVKASEGKDFRIHLTMNQKATAENLGDRYWIYFVPTLKQNHQNDDNIVPIVVRNPAKRLWKMKQIKISVDTYLIEQIDNLPLRQKKQGKLTYFAL